MLRVQPSRWDTKVQANSTANTSASSGSLRSAMYKHCGRPCDREIFTMSRPDNLTVRNVARMENSAGHDLGIREWIVGKQEAIQANW